VPEPMAAVHNLHAFTFFFPSGDLPSRYMRMPALVFQAWAFPSAMISCNCILHRTIHTQPMIWVCTSLPITVLIKPTSISQGSSYLVNPPKPVCETAGRSPFSVVVGIAFYGQDAGRETPTDSHTHEFAHIMDVLYTYTHI